MIDILVNATSNEVVAVCLRVYWMNVLLCRRCIIYLLVACNSSRFLRQTRLWSRLLPYWTSPVNHSFMMHVLY